MTVPIAVTVTGQRRDKACRHSRGGPAGCRHTNSHDGRTAESKEQRQAQPSATHCGPGSEHVCQVSTHRSIPPWSFAGIRFLEVGIRLFLGFEPFDTKDAQPPVAISVQPGSSAQKHVNGLHLSLPFRSHAILSIEEPRTVIPDVRFVRQSSFEGVPPVETSPPSRQEAIVLTTNDRKPWGLMAA